MRHFAVKLLTRLNLLNAFTNCFFSYSGLPQAFSHSQPRKLKQPFIHQQRQQQYQSSNCTKYFYFYFFVCDTVFIIVLVAVVIAVAIWFSTINCSITDRDHVIPTHALIGRRQKNKNMHREINANKTK